MKAKILIMIMALAMLALSSCTKKDAIDQQGIDLADNDAVSEAVFEDIFNSADDAEIALDDFLKGETKSAEPAGTCPAVTMDRPPDESWPKTVTIDFGTECTGFYENTRSGKIIIVVTGPRLEENSVKTVTFENYFFNGVKVEGTKEVKNLGLNADQKMEFSVKLTGGKLTLEDGTIIQRSFERQREWIVGMDTKSQWDDEFLVTGITTGVNRNDVEYINTIITPLHYKRACRFAVSGVVKIERGENSEPVELNYGNGECDATAVITKGEASKEITLRYRYRACNCK